MNKHSPNEFKSWSESDIDLLEEYYACEARENLWAFRQYMDAAMIKGWWPQEVARQFQLFYNKLIAGERPKLVIEAPPQHGKTRGLQDFVSWASGKSPHLRTIYASFSDDLGVSTNSFLQRRMDDDKYRRTFPDTRLNSTNASKDTAYQRNSSLLEFVGQKGSFRNVTVNGQVNGKSLDLGVIDDPLKGREQAQSKAIRDKTWNWLMDDYFSRFDDAAGLIITMTRWHIDDPTGRFIEHFPECVVLKYPAMAVLEPREGLRNDAWDPRKVEHEPLFPQFKSKAFLNERKKSYTVASWESLYQQSPIVSGGGMFPVAKIKYVRNAPNNNEIKKLIRYWDKAGTSGGGAYTCGVLIALLNQGDWVVIDVVRGQWSALEREQNIKATTEADEAKWGRFETWIEQEPGSGGKESAERTVANLAGYTVKIDKVTGAKEIRAEPYAAQWQGGNISLVVAKWNQDYVDEHEVFPTGKYKDQVDAGAGAFAKTIGKQYNYDTTMKWADAL